MRGRSAVFRGLGLILKAVGEPVRGVCVCGVEKDAA